MSRAQRAKGIRAELEVAALLRGHGFHARRDGRLDADLAHDLDGYHLEVRRRETLALPAWTRDAEHAAGGRVAIVCYRRSREPWHASLPLDALVRLLAIERDTPDAAHGRARHANCPLDDHAYSYALQPGRFAFLRRRVEDALPPGDAVCVLALMQAAKDGAANYARGAR